MIILILFHLSTTDALIFSRQSYCLLALVQEKNPGDLESVHPTAKLWEIKKEGKCIVLTQPQICQFNLLKLKKDAIILLRQKHFFPLKLLCKCFHLFHSFFGCIIHLHILIFSTLSYYSGYKCNLIILFHEVWPRFKIILSYMRDCDYR